MYKSSLAQFAAAGVSQAIVNASIEAQANAGRVPAHAIEIAHALGFELPAIPAALILALNAAENARPFNTKKGHALLLELFAMAQAIADSGKVKNLPALVLPEWATSEAREKAADEKAPIAASEPPPVKKAATIIAAPITTCNNPPFFLALGIGMILISLATAKVAKSSVLIGFPSAMMPKRMFEPTLLCMNGLNPSTW